MAEVNSKPISAAFPVYDSVVPRRPNISTTIKNKIKVYFCHSKLEQIEIYFKAMTPSSLEFCS
jgi:hypothetical protein